MCSKVRVKREHERVKIRWKPEKAILVGEADGGDVDGLGDRSYVTK